MLCRIQALLWRLCLMFCAGDVVYALPHVRVVSDHARLVHGARIYAEYCAGCHTLRYLREKPLWHELGFDEFKLGDGRALWPHGMQVALPAGDANVWFGQMPPDLSLITKRRGVDWVHAYLTGFEADDKRPWGTRNMVLPESMMPNALAPLQRQSQTHHDAKWDALVVDLVSFLDHVAEPTRAIRYRTGAVVLVYLLALWAIVRALGRVACQRDNSRQ